MPTVFKATKHSWAQDLITFGKIYFTNISNFINDHHDERGDVNEGHQVLIRNGHRCTIDYDLPVYVWCCTMDAQPSRVIATWHDRDIVIQITDTLEFAKRINSAVQKQRARLWPLRLGPVVYTKTNGGHEKADWADGIFQKDEKYDGQKEFRFALTGRTGDKPEDHILLELGKCDDIIRVALPLDP